MPVPVNMRRAEMPNHCIHENMKVMTWRRQKMQIGRQTLQTYSEVIDTWAMKKGPLVICCIEGIIFHSYVGIIS